MIDNLDQDLDKFVRKSEERMLAVARQSIQDVANEAQKPVGKGGRMRVKTGFLRASGRAAVGKMPSGQSMKPADATDGQFTYDSDSITSALAKLKLGDTFYFGWVANYARYREVFDGFLSTALQNWDQYVASNARKLRDRING